MEPRGRDVVVLAHVAGDDRVAFAYPLRSIASVLTNESQPPQSLTTILDLARALTRR